MLFLTRSFFSPTSQMWRMNFLPPDTLVCVCVGTWVCVWAHECVWPSCRFGAVSKGQWWRWQRWVISEVFLLSERPLNKRSLCSKEATTNVRNVAHCVCASVWKWFSHAVCRDLVLCTFSLMSNRLLIIFYLYSLKAQHISVSQLRWNYDCMIILCHSNILASPDMFQCWCNLCDPHQ